MGKLGNPITWSRRKYQKPLKNGKYLLSFEITKEQRKYLYDMAYINESSMSAVACDLLEWAIKNQQ